jgi:hypothetical protein
MTTQECSHSGQSPSRKRWLIIAGLALVLFSFSPASVTAADNTSNVRSEGSLPADAALGFASFLASIPYGAAKIGYAITGAVAGGLEYLYAGGKTPAVEEIWDSALGGTYILTPDHLRGKKEISFIGKTTPQASSSPAP